MVRVDEPWFTSVPGGLRHPQPQQPLRRIHPRIDRLRGVLHRPPIAHDAGTTAPCLLPRPPPRIRLADHQTPHPAGHVSPSSASSRRHLASSCAVRLTTYSAGYWSMRGFGVPRSSFSANLRSCSGLILDPPVRPHQGDRLAQMPRHPHRRPRPRPWRLLLRRQRRRHQSRAHAGDPPVPYHVLRRGVILMPHAERPIPVTQRRQHMHHVPQPHRDVVRRQVRTHTVAMSHARPPPPHMQRPQHRLQRCALRRRQIRPRPGEPDEHRHQSIACQISRLTSTMIATAIAPAAASCRVAGSLISPLPPHPLPQTHRGNRPNRPELHGPSFGTQVMTVRPTVSSTLQLSVLGTRFTSCTMPPMICRSSDRNRNPHEMIIRTFGSPSFSRTTPHTWALTTRAGSAHAPDRPADPPRLPPRSGSGRTAHRSAVPPSDASSAARP